MKAVEGEGRVALVELMGLLVSSYRGRLGLSAPRAAADGRARGG